MKPDLSHDSSPVPETSRKPRGARHTDQHQPAFTCSLLPINATLPEGTVGVF